MRPADSPVSVTFRAYDWLILMGWIAANSPADGSGMREIAEEIKKQVKEGLR